MKKYEFTGEVKLWLGKTLHQIKAVIAFGEVQEGEIGGWIENEENLAHDGDAWVFGNAMVYGDARVFGNAMVYGDAWVYGNARVFSNARVFGNAMVDGNARVYGDAWVYGNARVFGNAMVDGDARVDGNNRILMVGPFGSRKDTTTFCYANGGVIQVACGCFRGTIEAFAKKVQLTHADNVHAKNYALAIEIARNWICTDEPPKGE